MSFPNREPTPEEATQMGIMDAIAELRGKHDAGLLERLQRVDKEHRTFLTRLEGPQRAALTLFLQSISPAKGQIYELGLIAAMAAAFTIGHDYALEYGRLLRDDRK